MRKIYYEDQYKKEFVAEVESIEEIHGKYHVRLNETAFFPGGGGQQNDLGFIENIPVIDVYEKSGEVYHVLDKKLIKIHRVRCSIDWARRLDGMQHHLGQHVLSGCFYQLFNANTVSVHVGKEIATVDIQGILTEEQIRQAEIKANDCIRENIKVEMLTPTKSELKKIKVRRDLPNTDEEIRIVKIGDLDINACCGVHPSSTLDLGIIKIKKWQKHKGNTRIEYLVGNRAFNDYLKVDNFSNDICKYLSCGKDDVIKTINNLSNHIKELSDENKSLNIKLSDYQIVEMLESSEKIKDISIIKNIYKDTDMKSLIRLADRITERSKAIVLFALVQDDKANMIFKSSVQVKDISMNDLLKDAISLIDGRGGGSHNQAQGGGKNNSNLKSAMEYAMMKINKQLK